MAQKYQTDGNLIKPDAYFRPHSRAQVPPTLTDIEKVIDNRMEHYVSRLERRFVFEAPVDTDIPTPEPNVKQELSINSVDAKHACALLISSMLSGALVTILGLSMIGQLNTMPLFWLTASLPFIGTTVATLMIVLGVDRESYA